MKKGVTTMDYPVLFLLTGILVLLTGGCAAQERKKMDNIKAAVDRTIMPVMEEYHIAGMSVGITVHGKQYFYNYGVASKETKDKVTNETLFEIGSLSKTFTATLAAYAQANGDFSLEDTVSKYLPALRGTGFDRIQLLNLGTHTSGGLPLQLPDDIKDTARLMDYYKNWQPVYAPGTYRVYSNTGIGLLGIITARVMRKSFEDLIEGKLFPELGMTNSYINVPLNKRKLYAQGYNSKDKPVRLNPAILATEAYGIKSCTKDLVRFLEANMAVVEVNKNLQQAITRTHKGYFTSGVLTQDLIWEQYIYPVSVDRLLEGNSEQMILQANIARPLGADAPRTNVLINKTGSTNGFSTYAVFIPSIKTGIVILANKSYPINARVRAMYAILAGLQDDLH